MLKDKRHTDLKGATANMKGPVRVSFRKNKRYGLVGPCEPRFLQNGPLQWWVCHRLRNIND